jgi:PDZ domain-containing secreted protein
MPGRTADDGRNLLGVRRTGARVFFVPADQFKDAESQAGPMKIYPVKTLEQALNDLRALGGHVPLPSGHNGGA